jgi:hypothetical protein
MPPCAGCVTTVQEDAVVKSSSVPLAVPCAMKVWVGVPVEAIAFQTSALEPFEQVVVAPNVPSHT